MPVLVFRQGDGPVVYTQDEIESRPPVGAYDEPPLGDPECAWVVTGSSHDRDENVCEVFESDVGWDQHHPVDGRFGVLEC